MASAETLDLVLLQRLKIKHKSQIWDDALVTFTLAIATVAAIAAVVWYLCFAPGLMDLSSPIHKTMIELIAALPAPEAHNELKTVLTEQGYVSILQLNEITEMAKLEVESLPIQK
ncbi:hypothetical protein BOO92_13970 [Vibrio navarrensis]|uniref:hypothetical protein n=1 Tax=Vibrio navarrensis TaxID=29495 RepID=UPI0018691FFB|nr:hypothetical protein [Vibrio navarrensis]MBE3657784.1 hypothetical protein [Vibrio navarrensis]